MTVAATTPALDVIDVRTIAPHARHGLIFARFQALPVGGWFELHSDHEPLPLRQQFEAQWPGQFDWETLEAGPAQWRLRISRKPAGKSCCGCCGG
jgi:uncharacterized protein (DUF2249 family)